MLGIDWDVFWNTLRRLLWYHEGQFIEQRAKLSNEDVFNLQTSSHFQKDRLSKCGLDEQKVYHVKVM